VGRLMMMSNMLVVVTQNTPPVILGSRFNPLFRIRSKPSKERIGNDFESLTQLKRHHGLSVKLLRKPSHRSQSKSPQLQPSLRTAPSSQRRSLPPNPRFQVPGPTARTKDSANACSMDRSTAALVASNACHHACTSY